MTLTMQSGEVCGGRDLNPGSPAWGAFSLQDQFPISWLSWKPYSLLMITFVNPR